MKRRPRWILPAPVDDAAVDALAAALSVPRAVARLLVQRGFGDEERAKRFLRPRLADLHDATTMAGFGPAVDRLERAIRGGETVLVHGDYDVDGMCATTITVRTIRTLGGNAVPFIPHRLRDGYDLGEAGVAAAREHGATLVVTCDCGTTAEAAIASLTTHGIDVIVTDHHLPRGPIPTTLATVNPRRSDCEYPDKDLAAVAVAFKLALALANRMGVNDNFVWRMLDLVALATVADVAALRGENRVLVRYGLKMLTETENHGLRALIRSSGSENKPLTAGRVGFTLAPRLNAAGRIGHALRGVELLMSESAAEANAIARELEELNGKRQTMDRAALDEARAQAESAVANGAVGLVLASDAWHAGVIGIVASRIVEEFGRPTILVALEGKIGKGSGRSIPAFDLHAALGECAPLLLRYGGHRTAAGVTVARDNVAPFASRFDDVARSMLTDEDLVSTLRVDGEVALEDLTPDLEAVLRHFEPHGMGNPAPLFITRDVTSATPVRVVGRDGLRVTIASRHGAELSAIGWGMADRKDEFAPGRRFDLAFRLERDEWNGESRLQAKIADVAPR